MRPPTRYYRFNKPMPSVNPPPSFDDLYHRKLGGQAVDFDDYSRALDKLVDSVCHALDNTLRSTHGLAWSLAPSLFPLVYLSVYQRVAAGAFHAQSAVTPSDALSFQTLEDLMRSNAGDPAAQLISALSKSQSPARSALKLIPVAHEHASIDKAPAALLNADIASTRRKVSLSIGLTAIERIRFSLGSRATHIFRAKEKPAFRPNWSVRRQLIEAAESQTLDSDAAKALYVYLLACMPTYLLEGFADTLTRVDAHLSHSRALIFSIEFCRKPEVALAFAYIKAHRGLLVGCQHGGLYGQTDPTWPEHAENRISDIYLTWGYQYTDRHLALPSIRLSRSRFKRTRSQAKPEEILLVAPYIRDCLELAIHSPAPNNQATALNHSLTMLKPLLDSGQNMVLRCHPRNTEEELSQLIPLLQHPRLRLLKGKRGELASDCQHFTTTLFSSPNATGLAELAASDIPFFIVARKNDFWIQPDAMPVYEALIESGVWITETPVTASHIKTEGKCDERRRAFKEAFAYRSGRYLTLWSSLIRSLAKGDGARSIVQKHTKPFSST